MTRPVALLTDYGPGTQHVGALHAVIAAACPGADRVDLAHDIPPGDVRWGALVLGRLAPLLPAAVCVAVVDPGVGTDRTAIAIGLAGGGAAVGPDNGLLAGLFPGAVGAVRIDVPPGASATFHGRDVFAPAAARIASGTPLTGLGPEVEIAALCVPQWPSAVAEAGRIATSVIGCDRFGNLALDAGPDHLSAARFAAGDSTLLRTGSWTCQATVGRTFADVPSGDLLLYLDSAGLLSIAERNGSAAGTLGVEAGAAIELSGPLSGAGLGSM